MKLCKINIYGPVIFLLVFLFAGCNKENREVIKPIFDIVSADSIPHFNGRKAYEYCKTQVNFGPRNPGSNGHRQALNFLQIELNKFADSVALQNFTYTGYDNEILELTNIIAKFNPSAKNRIIISAHWDTRPRAEHAFDKNNVNKPILGANDGASGTAVILVLAELLKSHKPGFGVDLVLFDGEDYGYESDLMNFCLGSKYFASNISENNRPAFAVLLDMVGDKDAVFPKEGNSLIYAEEIVNTIWNIAYNLNATKFIQKESSAVYDDHIPLNQAGIRTVDIIDSYLIGANGPDKRRNYWHSDKDDMSNISSETLGQVGNVLVNLIYSLHFNY